MTIKIRKETRNIRGKDYHYNVARENGRIIFMKPWSKENNVSKAKEIFKNTGTLDTDIRAKDLKNVRIVSRTVKIEEGKPIYPKMKISFQYHIRAVLNNGVVINASSNKGEDIKDQTIYPLS